MLTEHKSKRWHFFMDEKDRVQGESKTLNTSGQIVSLGVYVNDKLHGERKRWWGNGQLSTHCIYANDLRHGECKEWGKDGTLSKHCFYINGEEIPSKEIPYPLTSDDLVYFKLKYNLPLLPSENVC